MVDVGVYPLTLLTAMFGPARRVSAYATTIQLERTRGDGIPFSLSTPDFQVAVVELESGVVARVTATFWVGPGKQRGLELHGDEASAWLADWAHFDARLERTTDGETYEPVLPLHEPYPGINWARPLVELAEAIADGRPHRMSAEHAAHVVEVLEAVKTSAAGGGVVEVESDFPRPEPLDWAR
jgi:predicted dehydrogenase